MTARMALDKLKEWFLYAFLFTMPIFYFPNMGDTREGQQKYFQGAGMIYASLYFGNIWITLFFLLNMLMFVIYGGVTGGAQVMNIFIFGVLFACSRNFFKDREIKPYLKPLFIVLVLSLVWGVFQLFRADLLGVPLSASGQVMTGMHNQFNGMFYHTIFHSMFMALMLPALILSFHWIFVLLVIPIGLLKCSGAILASAFVIPFIVYHKRRKLFIPLLVIMGLLAGGATIYDKIVDPKTYSSRLYSWHMMTRYTAMNPLGWGPDSFRNYNRFKNFRFESDENYDPMVREQRDASTEILSYYSLDPRDLPDRLKNKIPLNVSSWTEAHNEFIQFAFEYGIFGVILAFMFLKEFLTRFMVSDKSDEILILFCMIMALFFASFTQFPFHVARMTGIFGIILGAYWSKTDNNYKLTRGEYE